MKQDEAIILAGGFGTRLASLVADVPKPMAPVAGKAFLYHLLDRLRHHDFGRVIVATHHLAEAVEAIGPSHRGMQIDYIRESTPLGTGGAIRRALDRIDGDSALVLNGDTYIDIDYRAVLNHLVATAADLVLVVRSVEDSARYSLVEVDSAGWITGYAPTGLAGTPGLIGAGVYAVRRMMFEPFDLPAAFSFEADFLAFIRTLRVQSYRSEGYFVDIGIPEDYLRAQTELPKMIGIIGA